MAPGPIPWSAVMSWCDREGLDDDVTELLWVVVHGHDVDYLNALATKKG